MVKNIVIVSIVVCLVFLRRGVWLGSLLHAREWITGAVVMATINHVINNYRTDPDIKDALDKYVKLLYIQTFKSLKSHNLFNHKSQIQLTSLRMIVN